MSRNLNAISGRLSLRPPQRQSLETLDRVMQIAPANRSPELTAALDAIQSEYPSVTDFEREFPSLCFALATGVGKTRLMGAFVAYLHLEHGVNNFFVLAPNLTIYRKLIQDFTPNTRKYVFEGIGEFAIYPPDVITGETYEASGQLLHDLHKVKINIFNISKINSEVRGGKSPRIKRLSEYIGQSYFDYLAGLPDLVLLMDESHRYRASAGVRAINELKPILGLELTATPFTESPKGPVPFRNVIVDYPLARAIADGFVKDPAVVTRKDFNPSGMTAEDIEVLKLEDGVRLHEQVKAELFTYAKNTGLPVVKPFVLVIAKDVTHAAKLADTINSDTFFGGQYAGKVIQVDSSKTGAEEEEMIAKLLTVEHADNPTEIVIHVNMLKEGWDVTNLYTIVPLRAANARTLIEQSIGRGLRLPYGRRTGVAAVDRLNIIAHDRFQEVVDEANRGDSAIRMQQLILSDEELKSPVSTVVSVPSVDLQFTEPTSGTPLDSKPTQPPLFETKPERQAANKARQVLSMFQTRPDLVPTPAALKRPEVQAMIVREVEKLYTDGQLTLDTIESKVDIAKVVAKTIQAVEIATIAIPRIYLVPKAGQHGKFVPFQLDLSRLRFASPDEVLWIQHLQSQKVELVGLQSLGDREARFEDYVVSGLVEFPDVAYDYHSDLLFDLAAQVVIHFGSYLQPDEVERVLRFHYREIANYVHTQMLDHYVEDTVEFETKVQRGWSDLKPVAFTSRGDHADFRFAPADKSKIGQMVFTGFEHCLYPEQKFDSDTERLLAVIIDRDSLKWFRPAAGQLQLFYKAGHEQKEYEPDFIAETESEILMIECKARKDLDSAEVQAKKAAAEAWCARATEYNVANEAKLWRYALIPHDAVSANQSLTVLVASYRA